MKATASDLWSKVPSSSSNLDQESRDNQIYVGMSRARNHCVIVAPKAA
jgi:hypothetical protein